LTKFQHRRLDVVGRAFKRQHFGYQCNADISSFRKIQWHCFRGATKSRTPDFRVVPKTLPFVTCVNDGDGRSRP
jgi:hypothetical protein